MHEPPLHRPHTMDADVVMAELGASKHGLSLDAVAELRARYGENALPAARATPLWQVFLRQFQSPLIYVLLIAALVSLFLQEYTDAAFIFAVLAINAVIGTVQEYSAERSAIGLQKLVKTQALVERGGDTYEVDARELVPGDLVLLESGDKVPADLRILSCYAAKINESLLTGESEPVSKDPATLVDPDLAVGDRANMAFTGTLVTHGRARGVVVATALATEVGRIAESVLFHKPVKPPLLLRMERFTFKIAIVVAVAVVLLALVSLARGDAWSHVFFLSVALAVSAIPEGLPVAMTVALAIGMNRMSKRNVIVRKLVAVEALGSCTFIASDKTGTLTINELSVKRVLLPGLPAIEVSGEGAAGEGGFTIEGAALSEAHKAQLEPLCRACTLANEAHLAHTDGSWASHGDAVDVACLVMARKAGLVAAEVEAAAAQLAEIPFEPEDRYSASLNDVDGTPTA
jgi:magnesium-transporting ATPase (P-type)